MKERDKLLKEEMELEIQKDEVLVNATISDGFSSWFNALDIMNEIEFKQSKIRSKLNELDKKELGKT